MGVATSITYDANGQLTSVTDAMGGVTAYTYDVLNRVMATMDRRGNTQFFTYDVTEYKSRTATAMPHSMSMMATEIS